MSTKAIERRRSTSIVIWIVPLLALALAGWMLFKFYSDRGTEITVTFQDGSGLLERKTLLKYKGIAVGHVTKIKLHPSDISMVDVSISVNSNAIAAVGREGNEFWKVKPKVTLTEVSGLETIMGGLYIEIFPAKKTFEELYELPEKFNFIASQHKPFDKLSPGLKLRLKDKEGRFALDTPIIYKKFIVGSVVERELKSDGVEYIIHIKEKYKHLIKTDSRFWGLNSVDFKASMAGIKLKVDSLATLIAGGITFDSSDSNSSRSCAEMESIAEFQLYANKEAIEYDKNIITLMGDKAYNLDPDLSAVYYKGVEAGKIDSVKYNPNRDSTQINIRLKNNFSKLIEDRAYFWIVEPRFSLKGISGLDAIARGPYITFIPHKGDINKDAHFSLHVKPPKNDGKLIHLHAKEIGALRVGSGVFYNDIEVGYVNEVSLSKDKKALDVTIVIAHKYDNLLNNSSLFYLRNAIEADLSLSGVKIKAGSLKSMIQGGIAFDTDNLHAKGKKKSFKLHNSYAATEEFRYLHDGGKYFTLHADAPGSIKKGSPIYYKRFQAGKVLDMKFNTQTDSVDISVYIEKQFVDKINASTRFYNASGLDVSLDFPKLKVSMESIESLVSGALAFLTLDKEATSNSLDEFTLFVNHQSAEDEDYKATLHLEDSHNLHKGSKIIYKGITIGEISDLSLSGNGIAATMSIQKGYKYLMVEDTLISLANFELSLEGIKNPEAIINGASLHVKAGVSKTLKKDYILQDIISHENQLREGLRIAVAAKLKGSLKVGTPVLYRQIKIGDIEEYRLSDDSSRVEFSLFIEPCYAHLVRKNSRFYNASALGVEVSLSGIKVKTETVETMISGGIVLVTPTEFNEQAENMQVFTLKSKPKEEWLDWHPQLSSTNSMCQ